MQLIVFTGPSGSGKSTLAKEILACGPRIALVESHTNRLKRISDLTGEYRYLTTKQFLLGVKNGVYLWHVEHAGVRYGTPRAAIDHALAEPDHIGIMIVVPSVLDALVEHVAAYKRRTGDILASAVLCYVVPPAPEELIRRLRIRGDCDAHIERRMETEKSWEQDVLSKGAVKLINNSGSLDYAVSQVVGFLDLH